MPNRLIRWTEDVITAVTRFAVSRDLPDYCDLQTIIRLTDDDRVHNPDLIAPYIMVTHNGDYLTVYEVVGSCRESDETLPEGQTDAWQGRLARMTEALTAHYRKTGHKISLVHECDPDGGRAEIQHLLAPQYRSLTRTGLDLAYLLDEQVEKLAPWVNRERTWLVCYTGRGVLAGHELRDENARLGELATQLRSLGYCLLLAGQEVQRLKSAAGDEIWTLVANMGIRITGKIRDPKDTLEILQLMAGTEYRPEMQAMVQQAGLTGSHWRDDNRLILREQKKVEVEEVQALQEGENVTLFNGTLLRCSALYIKDADKFASEAVRINRFVEVAPPTEAALLAAAPLRQRRGYVRAERVQHILRVLDNEPGSQDTGGLVLTDPALAAVCEFELECEYSWSRPPSAAVRSAVLWRMVLASLPKRGRGYRVRLREPRRLTTSIKAIQQAEQHHVVLTGAADA